MLLVVHIPFPLLVGVVDHVLPGWGRFGLALATLFFGSISYLSYYARLGRRQRGNLHVFKVCYVWLAPFMGGGIIATPFRRNPPEVTT